MMRSLIHIVGIIVFALSSTAIAESDKTPQEMAIKSLLAQAQELRISGNYDEGIELAIDARTKALELKHPELEVEAHYQLSLLYYYQHNYSLAQAEMEVGLARARIYELEDGEADFLAAEGVLEWKQGNLHLALPKLQEAMAIREQMDEYISMASISNNIGIIYYSLKSYEDAEFYYRKGIELLENKDNDRLKGSLYSNLAEVLIPMDKLIEAEDYLNKALEIELRTNEPHNLAYTYFNMGELFSRKGDSEKAIGFYAMAMELQQEIQDKWAISLTHLRTGQEYLKRGQVDRSLKELKTGYDLAQELNALSLLRDYSEVFIKAYNRSGEENRVQFFRDQYEWLENRIQLEISPPQLNEPIPIQSVVSDHDGPISPLQTIIIVILTILIILLILENARIRHKMLNL